MHKIFVLLTVHLLFFSSISLNAASSWQKAEQAALVAQSDRQAAIKQLQNLLLDEPDLHVAHYNLGCILLDYQWQAEDDQRFGDQTRTLAKQALHMPELADIDPIALSAEHFARASFSPVKILSARALHNLALTRYKQGRLQDALAAAVRSCELFPKDEQYIQTRNELRRVYLEREDEARRKAEEEAKRLRLIKKNLDDAFEGRPYTYQLKARAGAGEPYLFSLAEDQKLPSALSMNSAGHISGTPDADAVGSHEIGFIVKDSADASDTNQLKIKVWPKPKILTEHLNEAIIKQSYSAGLQCEGLPKPQWFIDGLPAGLELKQEQASYARIEGSTDALGTHQINVTVKDEQHQLIAVQTLELVVSDSFAPDTSTMPDATAWAAYKHPLKIRGPVQQYTYFSDGSGGLHIDEQGVIGGKAEEAGELEFPLSITAADKRERSFIIKMKVNPPPIIKEEEHISLAVGSSLNRALQVEGGTPPYNWSLAEGLLPDGVRLEKDGRIAGAASQAEEAPVTLVVEDRWAARSTKEVTLNFQAQDPNQQQDQQQSPQDQQDQQGQQDQQQAQQQDQQDQQDQQHNQDDQSQDGEQGDTQQQAQAGEAGDEDQEAQDQQEAQIKQADIQRWLDDLPEESKRALLMQMLNGKTSDKQVEDPW